MRKTITAIITLVVIWACYTAWPIYDLLILVRALDNRNISTVQEHLDFGRIRASLTSQIVAAYVRRTGVQITPRVQQLAGLGFSIADPVVNKLISPEALSELLSEGWPITVSDPPYPSPIGINSHTVGTIWQVFVAAEYGLARFEATAPIELPVSQRFRLTFRLLQWRWRLVGITLPDQIQNVLADEVIKALPTQH
jgi:DUF2939 family protein